MIRMAYVDTDVTGGGLDVKTPEGTMMARRVDPHGVVLVVGQEERSIEARHLAEIGRFFLAAAMKLGQDINEGWDIKP